MKPANDINRVALFYQRLRFPPNADIQWIVTLHNHAVPERPCGFGTIHSPLPALPVNTGIKKFATLFILCPFETSVSWKDLFALTLGFGHPCPRAGGRMPVALYLRPLWAASKSAFAWLPTQTKGRISINQLDSG